MSSWRGGGGERWTPYFLITQWSWGTAEGPSEYRPWTHAAQFVVPPPKKFAETPTDSSSFVLFRRVFGSVVGVLVGGLVMAQLGVAQTPLSPGASFPTVEGSLQRVEGASTSPSQLLGKKGTVFLFWSNDCPWIDRYEQRVQALVQEAKGDGIQVVRVNANDAAASQKESLEASRARAQEKGYQTPYVRDPTGAFARALGATRTPQAFVFNSNRTLVYVGAIDDSPSGAEQVDTHYLRNAVEALKTGQEVPKPQTTAFGCALKYPK